MSYYFFFFNGTATTTIYTYRHPLSLHDALPIFLLDSRHQRLVAIDQFASPFGVAGLGIAPRRRALDDRAELIGAAREFEVGLQKLDARARVDGEHALGLEHAQRVAQWLHRNAEQDRKSTRLNSRN